MARIRDQAYPEEDHAMWLGIAQFLGLLLMVMSCILPARARAWCNIASLPVALRTMRNATMGQ